MYPVTMSGHVMPARDAYEHACLHARKRVCAYVCAHVRIFKRAHNCTRRSERDMPS